MSDIEQEIRRRSRRAFLTGGVTMLAGYGIWRLIAGAPREMATPAPLRRMLGLNESIARGYFSNSHLARTYTAQEAQAPRVNGMLGLSPGFDPAAWQLQLAGLAAQGTSATLPVSLDTIRSLPRAEMVTELRCIEGWTDIVHWGGARLADLIALYPPATTNGTAPDVKRRPDALLPYVSIETPDRGYYVGLEMASALHPQTLLCYEINGRPLTPEHGAPLRLVVPVKYGIKNIKRIGTIRFTAQRPADYWAEQGYDWYAGL
jgi:DMSO/TMAO reductase YedYZ molybdopterin-dependent catalytic subunit